MQRALSLFIPLIMLAALCTAEAGSIQTTTGKTVWNGVFTTDQATRGKEAFTANCAMCHGPELEGGNAPSLKGNVFMLHWAEDTLDPLFARVKSMPPRSTVQINEATQLDMLAYILWMNIFPAGNEALRADALGAIRVESKEGPGFVPAGALVEVAGCLAAGPDQTWNLTNATPLVRSRNPNQPAPAELLTSVPLGTQTYRLLYPESFAPGFHVDAHRGHKMQARGFLIRTSTDIRINITWLEMLSEMCGQ